MIKLTVRISPKSHPYRPIGKTMPHNPIPSMDPYESFGIKDPLYLTVKTLEVPSRGQSTTDLFPPPPQKEAAKTAGMKTLAPALASAFLEIIELVLHALTFVLGATVLGLNIHTVRLYTMSQDINFSGINISWPHNLNVLPVHLMLGLAAVTMAYSFTALTHTCCRPNARPTNFLRASLFSLNLLLCIVWIIISANNINAEHATTPTVRHWACRRVDSPSNAVVGYAPVCRDQVSLQKS